jgi:amino acid permease
MMDDSQYTKKGPTTFVHGPEMESSLNAGDTASAGGGPILQEEEIKRDLHSRHINMIAIAGMIVRAYFH